MPQGENNGADPSDAWRTYQFSAFDTSVRLRLSCFQAGICNQTPFRCCHPSDIDLVPIMHLHYWPGGGQWVGDLRSISIPRRGGFGRVDGNREVSEICQTFLPDVVQMSDV
jgi:hypothetical protein